MFIIYLSEGRLLMIPIKRSSSLVENQLKPIKNFDLRPRISGRNEKSGLVEREKNYKEGICNIKANGNNRHVKIRHKGSRSHFWSSLRASSKHSMAMNLIKKTWDLTMKQCLQWDLFPLLIKIHKNTKKKKIRVGFYRDRLLGFRLSVMTKRCMKFVNVLPKLQLIFC